MRPQAPSAISGAVSGPGTLALAGGGISLASGATLTTAALSVAAGATLDVFEHEPLPADHPWRSDARIAITPHISALTVRSIAAQQIAEKLGALSKSSDPDVSKNRAAAPF